LKKVDGFRLDSNRDIIDAIGDNKITPLTLCLLAISTVGKHPKLNPISTI